MKKTRQFFSGLLAAALILSLAAFVQTTHAAPAEDGVVSTSAGQLRGTRTEYDGYRFLGVPYAQAEERFVPAKPVEPWEGVRGADSYGDISPQGALFGGTGSGEQPGTSNNCQNLNIWTPAVNDGGKRPVMVWLHGGGFSSGSGNDAGYDGTNLSQSGDVVVVTVNHRLNLFGFLDLSAYGEKYVGSGNAGLSDIVAALEWIQKNIEAFGGDPDNVTVFGQSGGGAKVLALMTAPVARGLFHKGIVQSGATETMGVTFASKEASTKLAEHMLAELDLTAENIEDIQTVSEADLQAASAAALQATAEEFQIPAALGEGYQMEWGPVVDGEYLPTDPVTAESFAEAGKDIPLLIGSNLLEWNFFPGQSSEASPELEAAVRAAYPGKPELAPSQVDTLLRPPLLKIMSHKAAQGGAPVYSYLFTYGMSFHGAEIPYVFDNLGENATEAEQALAKQISQVWVNFARNGIPSADGLPEWEPYTQAGGAAMLLDMEPKLVHHHDRAVMALEAPELGYYTDVPANAWYARAAEYAAENELMNGVGSGRFAPGQTTSRAMLAAILWRVAGEPAADGAIGLADVPDGQWYTQAIRWAASQNILTGYGNGRFGPGDPVSRQDMVTILWRYADKPQASAPDFADEGSIDGYAAQAVDWARANEIISGVGDNKFDPAGIADRAQTAVILHNFLTLEG